MEALLPLAERIAAHLKSSNQTVAIAESSTGGLMSAAMLAVPGASVYFVAGAVVYTMTARLALLGISEEIMAGFRPSSEPYATLLAERMRERHETVWGVGESGAAGPTGIDTATVPDIPALRSLGPPSGRSRSKPATATGRQTWLPSPPGDLSCSPRR
jgi:PncC family amidohydrolase